MRTFMLTVFLGFALFDVSGALAKGSCCSHPPATVYIYGPTSVPGIVQPGHPATLAVRSIIQYGSFASASVTGSAFSVVSTNCSGTVCYTNVAFNPSEGGNYTSLLTINASGFYGKGSARTTLSGIGYGANYAWSPPVVTTVTAGTTGSVQLALHSTGQIALTFQGLTLAQNSTYLTMGPTTCSTAKPLAPGSSCVVNIDYDASLVETDLASYPMDGTVTVVAPNSVTNLQGVANITAIVPGQGGG